MVTIPAVVWRGGFVCRALTLGVGFGLCAGVLGWLDSGVPAVGGIAFMVVGVVYGTWMARRMVWYWPESTSLTGDERVAVVRVARRGDRPPDERLGHAVVDYCRALHASADAARPVRWVIRVVLVVAVSVAVWDAVNGSWGNLLVSVLYLVALIAEAFWWPKRLNALLDNACRAAQECH